MLTISDNTLAYVYYDESSPTCLRWNRDIVVGKGLVKYKKHEIAGGLNKRFGYYMVQINKVKYRCHRIVWRLFNTKLNQEIDHKDRDRLNNKIENLRPVTRAVNTRNANLYSSSTSKITGICYRNIRGINYIVAQAWSLDRKRLTRAFNVDKLGSEVALSLALEARRQMINELNLAGAGYSLTHGNAKED